VRLGIVGSGRAAQALAPRWIAAGHEVVWQQRRADLVPLEARPEVEVVVLAVRDGDLAEVARALGTRPAAARERWLHLSGATAGTALRQSGQIPLACGALHPLVALSGASGTGPLGAVAGIDGDPAALEAARRLAADCGLTPVTLADVGAKALYHAAAVTVAGHLTALVSQGLTLMQLAGLSLDDAYAALLPLARSAVSNLALGPPEVVITGPVARGDLGTVARHLAALAAAPHDVAVVYRALAREAVALSVRAGSLSEPQAAALRDLLADGRAFASARPPQMPGGDASPA
jgi:predicted short-subunit dehydrogenase-like oxidoreductase (DUF2520 family)